MVLLDLSIFPLDKGESVSHYVAMALDVIDGSGLKYRCHAMGTCMEGELDQTLEVVRRCFEVLQADCRRIECSIRIDYREGEGGRLDTKVQSLEDQLGRSLRQ